MLDYADELGLLYFEEPGGNSYPDNLFNPKNELEKKQTAFYLGARTNVDSLTRKMGNVAYYYQGRVIENVRINNTIDGYAVNGWESIKLENHSGIVDNYRNLKGDADLIAKYNQPLYVAVKLNRKVVAVGDSTMVDLYLVNEKSITGNYTLEVSARNANGETGWKRSLPVEVKGQPIGDRYSGMGQ